MTLFENKTWHNTNFRFSGGDNSWTIGPNQTTGFVFQVFFYSDHIAGRNAFCYTNNNFNTGIGSFHNCISSKCRRHKYDRHICTCAFNSLLNRVKYRTVKMLLSTFTRGNTTHNLSSIFYHLTCMIGSLCSSKSLNDDFRMLINQYAHNSCLYCKSILIQLIKN